MNQTPTTIGREIRVWKILAITALVDATLDAAAGRGWLAEPADIDAALAVDHNARSLALALLPEIAVKSS